MGNFKKINGNFVTTSAQVAQDKRLSWKARGIFLYLASMSDGWNFYVDEIAKHAPQGKRALQNGLKELEEYGYLKRVRTHKPNGDLSSLKWELHYEPVELQKQNSSEAVLLQKRNEPLINNNNNKYQETININNNNKRDIREKSEDFSVGTSSDHIPYSEIVDYLNERTGKHYRASSQKTRRLIRARLNECFTIDDFKKVIDNKCSEWLRDDKMSRYLRPETLFGTKFESYLNQDNKNNQVPNGWAGYYEDNGGTEAW